MNVFLNEVRTHMDELGTQRNTMGNMHDKLYKLQASFIGSQVETLPISVTREPFSRNRPLPSPLSKSDPDYNPDLRPATDPDHAPPTPKTCPNHLVVAVLRSMAARWPALTKQGMNAETEFTWQSRESLTCDGEVIDALGDYFELVGDPESNSNEAVA